MNMYKAINGEYLTNYPTFHIMKDSGIICNRCIRSEAQLIIAATVVRHSVAHAAYEDSQWTYEATEINYEDTCLICDHCNKRIVSACCDDDDVISDPSNEVW